MKARFWPWQRNQLTDSSAGFLACTDGRERVGSDVARLLGVGEREDGMVLRDTQLGRDFPEKERI